MKIGAVIALFCVAVPAAGQSVVASLGGIVADGSGEALPGATLTIVHPLNGRRLTLTAGRAGEYRFVGLLPGDYDVTAEAAGFARTTQRVTLLVGSAATLNFALALAGMDVQLTVQPEIPLLQTAQSQPYSAVVRPQLDSLPVFDRNFLVLAQILPGCGPINSTVNRFAFTKFGGVADQRSGYTTLVDGGDVDDAQWGSPTINVGLDAIQEFKVFRGQFDAQYGHALSAVVVVATRSGTNRFAATGFYFGRDSALNARNAFARDKPPFHEHRIGGSAGGPLVRNRSHLFAAYEADSVDDVRIIALPPENVLAATSNGVFPAASTDQMMTLRLDHRFNPSHAVSARYNQEYRRSLRANLTAASDTNQTDVFNRSHSLVAEDTWSPAEHLANTLRLHLLHHSLGTTARNADVGISRPAGNIGQTNRDSQVVPRTRLGLSETVYIHRHDHQLKLGAELVFAVQDVDSHVLEHGLFRFATDTPFNPDLPSTWPTQFEQQKPTQFAYVSRELSLFAQHDWRFRRRVHLNIGLRYDLDLNLRINAFYAGLLNAPGLAELGHFISRDRGTDTNNLQPRLGATWDARGDGHVIVRGGVGLYVTRNRPWYQLRAMNQAGSSVVRISDPALLRHYPDVDAVLGGRTLDDFIATGGPRQLGTVIPDDFVLPYAVNTTAGVGWQLKPAVALDIDYVHAYGAHQVGSTDRNLPGEGPLSRDNPRPVPQFSQVVMLENFGQSWYDALETQLRGYVGAGHTYQVSYTLSRSYLDGVDFFLATRGMQRTPAERGYNPTDQRHNLTISGYVNLPWSLQASGILKLVSGSPIKVQAGRDLDGDGTAGGDRPAGVPITVGRSDVDASLAAINVFRASLLLSPIDRSLLGLDPYRTLDARITKTIALHGSQRLELLFEGFNLTNHVNFRPPLASVQPESGVSINAAAVLVRTSAREARQLQWGVRYRF
jgi:hypothetical protein